VNDRRQVRFDDRRDGTGRLQDFGLLDFIGRRPIGRQRLVRGTPGRGRAARQKKRCDKNGASRFKHAAIVRNAQSDSSCFSHLRYAIYDGSLDPGARKLSIVNHKFAGEFFVVLAAIE
jgi:hypothetical protein